MQNISNYQNCIDHSPKNFQKISVKSEEGVIACLKLAEEKNTSIYPVSTGNNWGYGASAPMAEDTIVVSLAEMNSITGLDPELGTISLEPGVTYKQLSDFLIRMGDEWLAPVHGGGPNCSVLANILERGFGITPIEDHFSSLLSVRAILPDGSLYQSSFPSKKAKALGACFKAGPGPYLDGIFTQSNLGVVTRVTIRLAPKKKLTGMGFVKIKNHSSIEEIIQCISSIQKKYSGILGGVNLLNAERMASMLVGYPKENITRGLPIDDESLRKNLKAYGISNWTIVFSIYGEKSIVKAATKLIKKDLKSISSRTSIFHPHHLKIINFVRKFLPKIGSFDLKNFSSSLQSLFEILDGIPNNRALSLAYWMNEKTPKNLDTQDLHPDKDGSGLIWYSPIVPMKAKEVKRLETRARELSKKYNINPLLTFTSFDFQSFECTFPILYNKNIAGSADNAKNFYKEIFHEMWKMEILPYRLPLFAMEYFDNFEDDSFSKLSKSIKDHLDPKALISPGRYIKG